MINLPVNCQRTYVNQGGNLSASGYYRSEVAQRLANQFPRWMHLRQNPSSVGQQLLSAPAIALNELEDRMDYEFSLRFIDTAPVSEIDVIYRANVPTTIDLTDGSRSVKVLAAPSGAALNGAQGFWVNELSNLEEFYYHSLPTRIEVVSSGDYQSSIDGVEWNFSPSGVNDTGQKFVDTWRNEHDITWAYSNGMFLRQDRETLESYDQYTLNGSGMPSDIFFNNNMLWWVGIEGNDYFLNINSTKIQSPPQAELDSLAVYNITPAFELQPSGIIIDEEGTVWISTTNKDRVYKMHARKDYFVLDRGARTVYLREDYRDSGIFMTNN